MFIKFTALLSLFHLIFADNSTNLLLAGNVSDSAIDYETMKLKNFRDRLEVLQIASKTIRMKVNTLGTIMSQNFQIRKDFFTNEFEKLKKDLVRESYRNFSPRNAPMHYRTRNAPMHYRARNSRTTSTNDTAPTEQLLPAHCGEAVTESGRNGIHQIKVPGSKLKPFEVYCLQNTDNELKKIIDGDNNDAWMVIQRRQNGQIDFDRKWSDYKKGIGNLEGEFFMGLRKLNAVTQSKLHELWIEMEDFDGVKHWAKYKTFAVGNEKEGYALSIVGTYSGDTGDSLSEHAGQKLSTKDKDNDNQPQHCAMIHTGAWWYLSKEKCRESNFNGKYYIGGIENEVKGDGVIWSKWHGLRYSLKYVHMAIRPVSSVPYCT